MAMWKLNMVFLIFGQTIERWWVIFHRSTVNVKRNHNNHTLIQSSVSVLSPPSWYIHTETVPGFSICFYVSYHTFFFKKVWLTWSIVLTTARQFNDARLIRRYITNWTPWMTAIVQPNHYCWLLWKYRAVFSANAYKDENSISIL